MEESAPDRREIPRFGRRLPVADASALVSSDPPCPFDELVDRHAVVRIEPAAPVEPSTIAAVAHWFGALAAAADRGRTSRVWDVDPQAVPAPERLHQDFPAGRRAAYSVLYVGVLPKPLPMTFVDLRRVCADLRPPLRSWVTELQQGPGQPLVARHPRTAYPILLPPPRRGGSIEGLSEVQAASLIDELWEFIDTSPHRLELEMRANDLMVWDALAVAYANPPLLHADDCQFLVAPLDAAALLVRPDRTGD